MKREGGHEGDTGKEGDAERKVRGIRGGCGLRGPLEHMTEEGQVEAQKHSRASCVRCHPCHSHTCNCVRGSWKMPGEGMEGHVFVFK